MRLVPYNPDYLDESVLWSESNDTGGGYRCIRMINNIRLNFDALHGDKDHGGVRDGTSIVLWEWLKGDNQRWKIEPQSKLFQFFSLVAGNMWRLYCAFISRCFPDEQLKIWQNYSVSNSVEQFFSMLSWWVFTGASISQNKLWEIPTCYCYSKGAFGASYHA